MMVSRAGQINKYIMDTRTFEMGPMCPFPAHAPFIYADFSSAVRAFLGRALRLFRNYNCTEKKSIFNIQMNQLE